MYPFYYVATFLVKVLLRLLTSWTVTGQRRVPREGGLVIVSNHVNNIDPPVLSASIPRRIVFMAKEELYYATSLSGLLTRGFGAFPVRRGEVDRRALRQARRALEKGLALGMFPEGTRSPMGQMQTAQVGTAWIALEAGVPILPVAIWGTEAVRTWKDVFCRPMVRVNIGNPFRLSLPATGKRVERLAQATDIIMEQVASLLPQGYRGVYRKAGLGAERADEASGISIGAER